MTFNSKNHKLHFENNISIENNIITLKNKSSWSFELFLKVIKFIVIKWFNLFLLNHKLLT